MSGRQFRVGDLVEVRSKQEILSTLDEQGRLEGMPFMPEMLAFCGQRFRVFKSAHKTCDTVFPIRSRRVERTVHLQTRCDGRAHGGCEAGCLLFWKEEWLKPASEASLDAASVRDSAPHPNARSIGNPRCNEDMLRNAAQTGGGGPTYVCQATQLPYATQDLSPFDVRQYVQDLASGNVTLGEWLRGLMYIGYDNLINLGIGLGRPLRWFYDLFQRVRQGIPYPRHYGKISADMPTPGGQLDLREGELVRVKRYEEILATCNVRNQNRGLLFDAEMVPYCGKTYRVHKRVTKIVNEKDGKLLHMKNPCIILENVFCRAWYSSCRMFCPRQIYAYWREIWLERV